MNWAAPMQPGLAVRSKGKLAVLIPVEPDAAGAAPWGVFTPEEMAHPQTWRYLLRLAPAHYTDLAAYWAAHPELPMDELIRLCGLRPDYRNRADWQDVGKYPTDVLTFGKQFDFAPAVLRLWERIGADQRAAWSKLWEERNIKKNFIREIIQDVYDLEDQARDEVLQAAQQLAQNWKAKSRPFPGEKVRDLVRQKRYPKFESNRAAIEQARSSFPRIPGVLLDIPANLEDDTLTLRMQFTNVEQLQTQCQKALAAGDSLRAILDLI